MPRPARRTSLILILALLALVIAFAAWRATHRASPEPRFTLFVHPADESHDPAKVVAAVFTRTSEHLDWSALLPKDLSGAEKILWIEQIGGGGSARLFGGYSVRGGELYFTPSAPLLPGATYHVAFAPPDAEKGDVQSPANVGFAATSGHGRLDLMYQVPAATAEAPKLQTLHPTAEELPANHLKFYLTFSEPMEQGVFLERIKLLRADGSEIAGPFRETELWSPDGRRLTVWLHPGRQKTGVSLNEAEGAVLREGETVALNVSGAWRSVRGQKLGVDFKRSYRIAAAARGQVDPSKWSIQPPKANTRDPLRILFPGPLDWALLQDGIRITSDARQPLDGRLHIADGDGEWLFTPKTPWQSGSHLIVINPVLEDLAGNNLNGPFEADATASAAAQPSVAELPLRIE